MKSNSLRMLIVLLIGLGLGYFVSKNININNSTDPLPTASKKTNTVNLSGLGGSNTAKDYFRSQITTPAGYYATDDEMLTPYDSQGGGAPPRLILMKDYQVLGENYYDEIKKPSNNCIVIWSTIGFSSIDEWINISELKGDLGEKEEVKIALRNAEIYTLTSSEGKKLVGYLPIKESGGTSYYFNTCNTNNKFDFIDVIKSIKFRADVNF